MHNENADAHLTHVDAAQVQAIVRPDKKLMTLYVIYALASAALFPIAIIPLYFRFKTLRYRFDDQGVAVSYGILWRRETYLTYARIQDIHVTRNIFERWLGIGTVQIQTASGTTGAAESIVGVREFNDIRNYLYAHMRGHSGASSGATNAASESTIDVALTGIRDELRAVREAMEGRKNV